MRVLVILNQAAGTLAASPAGDEPLRIRDGFVAHGIDAEVRDVDGAWLASVARGAATEGFDAVVAGGGDGTLNTIANALAGGPVAFGVLPLGTHNHFAKELGVPLDLDAAVAALARGTSDDLDVGEVNGRVFLNFSGLGLHPMFVKHRDAQREVLGRRKFVAMFFALFSVLRRLPVRRVRLRFGDTVIRRTTPSVIVCNNPLQMKLLGVENVSTPDRGVLNVYLARATKWYGVIWLILRAAVRRLDSARKFEALALSEFSVEARHSTARVSVDGEVTDMPTPLHYRVRRGGLKVIRPAALAPEAQAETMSTGQ
jgi:diacylglycerol kinase family enzyme